MTSFFIFKSIRMLICVTIIVVLFHQVKCIRYGDGLRNLGITRSDPSMTFSSMAEKMHKKKQEEIKANKQREQDDEAYRRNRIFQQYLKLHGMMENTSVLKDFFTGRYK
jgi:hypothetical protein